MSSHKLLTPVLRDSLLVTLLCSFSLASCQSVQAQNRRIDTEFQSSLDWRSLEPGISYSYMGNQFSSNLHFIKVDLENPAVTLSLSSESSKGESPVTHAYDYNAVVSINASFFDGSYNPRGITVSQGSKWSKMLYPESSPFLGCDVELQCNINHKGADFVDEQLWTAVGGLHSLIVNGEMRSKEDDQTCGSFCLNQHPRTAVGLSQSKRYLILALAEGRKQNLKGLTLQQMSIMMHYAGSFEAFNLDGGGSSSLVVNQKLTSQRPDKEPSPRRVSNSLLINSN